MTGDLRQFDSHFAFGEKLEGVCCETPVGREYCRSRPRPRKAVPGGRGFADMIFLDIGCLAPGLSMLAALRLGARSVTGIDIPIRIPLRQRARY